MAPALTSDPVAASPLPTDQPAVTGGAMSVDQTCEYTGMGKTKFYAEVKAGRLEVRKNGSKSVVFRSEAERWLRSLPTATAIEELERSTKAKARSPRRSTSETTNAESHQGTDLGAEVA
jgi:hypothetical protein